MNQKVKRLLACILSALTISSALPVMANAANTGDAAETEEVEYFRDGDDIPIDLDEIDQDLVIRNVQDYYEFEEQNDQYAGLDRDADTETPDEMAQRLYGEYDNSVNENAKYLPAIKSQGGIGSCVAWAEVYYQYTDGVHCKESLHLSCEKCGKTYHMNSECAKMLIENLAQSDEFAIDKASTVLYGVCRECQKQ